LSEARPLPVRILIVDDHTLFRESIARLLAADSGFEIIGHCASSREALPLLTERSVDILLLDFDLGAENGLDLLRVARERGFQGKVLVVTAGIDRARAAELIETGIAGVFMKHNSAASLARGIRDVMAGQVWFDQELFAGAWSAGARAAPTAGPARLTDRERLVVSGVLEGLANKQIAARLGVSESSVKASLQQLFSKMGVRTRSQLVRVVLERHRGELLATAPP
jgi:DNA-binding NarL/FixJ family response regulator